MHKLGSILAAVFNKVFILALILVLFTSLISVGVASLLTNRQQVKNVLSESGVYTTVPENILDIVELPEEGSAEKTFNPGPQSELVGPDFQEEQPKFKDNKDVRTVRQALEENDVIDPDELIALIKRTLDEPFLTDQVEGVIDGVYNYLDGTSETLEFEISLSSRADTVVREFKEFVSDSLESLPKCDTQQPQQVDEDDVNILDINCLPPDSNLDTEIDKFIDELNADDGVLGESYTPQELGISEVELAAVKVVYNTLQGAATFFWIIIIGLAFAVILTAKTIHRGFKEVGIIFTVMAGLYLVAFGAIASSFDATSVVVKSEGISPEQEQAIRNIAEPLAESFAEHLASHIIIMSLAIMVIGIASFIFGIVLTKHHVEHLVLHKHHEPSPEQEKTAVSEENIQDPAKQAPRTEKRPQTDIKKPKKMPRKIQ